MSESAKKRKASEETKRKISESLIGNTRTLGKSQSEETKKKISESLAGNTRRIGKLPWNKNKSVISDEQLKLVFQMKNEGKFNKDIAIIIGCHWSYIPRLIKRYQKNIAILKAE
jgi:hypothetical protein